MYLSPILNINIEIIQLSFFIGIASSKHAAEPMFMMSTETL